MFDSQFGFRPHHSTNQALITITEHIRSGLDKNNFTCGVFLDFQKAFDTVNHGILLSKLSYYGVRGIAHDLFKSYLTNRKQHTIINGVSSSVLSITHGVLQGSVLGTLLFLIYINDLNHVVKHSTVHHFADDTNSLYFSSSLKSINKCINHDLKLIVHWLRANRISLNVNKTEIILFRRKSNTISTNMNFPRSGQKIIPTTHTKYLGILMDEHLSWDQHLKMLKQKLSRANGLLAKARYYLSPNLLRTLYFSIFESHLRYGCQIWGHHNNHNLNDIANVQRKAIRIINFKSKYTPVEPLFKETKIMTLNEIIKSENCLLALHHINQCLPLSLKNLLRNGNDLHNYST